MKRENILAPSLLAADFKKLGEDIGTVTRSGAKQLHLDVMDGVFVPSISFGMPVISSIRPATDALFDVHLMIEQPERYIGDFAKAGADIITVHIETTNHASRLIQMIKSCGCRACLALNPQTPLAVLDYLLPYLDMVLLMTVNPGFGGQAYIPEMTEKIAALRQTLISRDLDLDIEVDGGIDSDTLPVVLEAGANVIVAGSAVFRGDPAANVKDMLGVMEGYKDYQQKGNK